MATITEQFNSIIGRIDTAIDIALQDEVANTMKDLVSQSVETNVYNAYNSNAIQPYVRRGNNGGLADTSNYITYVGAGHTLFLENATTGNEEYAPYDNFRITDIIETGIGYNWETSVIYHTQQPRPFMDEAIQSQHAQIELSQALGIGLAKQGYQTGN